MKGMMERGCMISKDIDSMRRTVGELERAATTGVASSLQSGLVLSNMLTKSCVAYQHGVCS